MESIVENRLLKRKKIEKLLAFKPVECRKGAEALLKALTNNDLEPFIHRLEVQFAFINARFHRFRSDLDSARVFCPEDSYFWNSIHVPKLDEYEHYETCDIQVIKDFINYRRKNVFAYLKSLECNLFRDELLQISRNNLNRLNVEKK